MTDRVGLRFWTETGLALLSSILALATIVHRDWIETVFGVDPDQHSGAVEWLIVLVALGIAVTAATMARREWLRRRAVAA
jgi:hypothetical protein